MISPLAKLFADQRKKFPALRGGGGLARLNNAAGSEMPDVAIEAMATWMRSNLSNEGHGFRRLDRSLEMVLRAREFTADLLGASPVEIGFGANTTTNLFFIARALGRTLLKPGDRVFVSEACHEANIAPWLTLSDYGASVELIPMRSDTHLDYEWLEANIDERVRIISVGASSNGTGTIHDLPRVVRAARSVSALVSIDAAHYVPHRPLDVRELDADLVFFSIYKCYGPHLGAFYVRRSLCEELPPIGNPRPPNEEKTASRFETGTRSHEPLAGWMATLQYLEELGLAVPRASRWSPRTRQEALRSAMEAISVRETELVRYGDARLREIPGLEIYAQPFDDPRPRLGVFCFNLRGVAPMIAARDLDQAGVEAVTGHNGSFRTMARLAAKSGGIGIRLSLGHYNTEEDLDRAIDCLRRTAARHR